MGTPSLRTHSRYALTLPVTLEVTERDVNVSGRFVDLGAGGAAFSLDGPLRLGEEVRVRVQLEVPLLLRGTVVWMGWGDGSEVRLGVRFLPDSHAQVQVLLELMAPRGETGT